MSEGLAPARNANGQSVVVGVGRRASGASQDRHLGPHGTSFTASWGGATGPAPRDRHLGHQRGVMGQAAWDGVMGQAPCTLRLPVPSSGFPPRLAMRVWAFVSNVCGKVRSPTKVLAPGVRQSSSWDRHLAHACPLGRRCLPVPYGLSRRGPRCSPCPRMPMNLP